MVRRWLIDVPSPEVPQAEVTKLIDDRLGLAASAIVLLIAELFGRVNWWLPRWLDRILPTVALDAKPAKVATA